MSTDPVTDHSPDRHPLVIAGMPAMDTKRFLDGSVRNSLGGILFTASAAGPLARRADLTPLVVSTVGEDIGAKVFPILAASGCRSDGVRVVDARTQHSTITFVGPDERWEQVEGALPSLKSADFVPWLGARAMLLNFVTGNEMSLGTLRWLRHTYDGPIVMDYHTLALSTDKGGRRHPWRRDNWAAWIACADVVQMNRDEASTLAGTELSTRRACIRFARDLLGLGPTTAVITLAGGGAVGVESSGRRQRVSNLAARQPSSLVDTVGCGDVFLGALAIGWVIWGTLQPALRVATCVAGMSCETQGFANPADFETAWDALVQR